MIDKANLWSKIKQAGIITLWMLLLTGVIFSLAFVNREEINSKCQSIDISIQPKNELLFINRQSVLNTIQPLGEEKLIIGKKIIELNTPLIEKKLLENDYIKEAEVFTDMNGRLTIQLIQRRPILRIIKADGTSYYLDEDKLKMPISLVFTAHVPVASGNLFEGYKARDTMKSNIGIELAKIATYVDKHPFWKAQIEQIFVTTENEMVLIPKIGDHSIEFGTSENMEDKFDRLMLFYKEGLSRVGWDKYKTINVKYKNQIVCTKK